MRKLLILSLLPIAAFAQSAPQDFTLKGDLSLNRPVEKVYLRYANGDQQTTDSLQPKNGSFKFEGKISEPTAAVLSVRFAQTPGDTRPPRDGMMVFLQPGKTTLKAKDSLENNTVDGTQGAADFTALTKQEKPFNQRMNDLQTAYLNYRKDKNEQGMKDIEAQMDAMQVRMQEEVYGAFAKAHPTSPVALYAVKQYGGYEIDPVKVEPLFNSLPATTRQWPSAVSFKDRIDIAKKTAIGSYAMDFTQNDTLGRPVSLSSFKGKYVLVDFWASWCGPCRRENPNVVKAYNKYKNGNFTILGVSLDRPDGKEKWLKAIHDDGLAWNHVSDLKFWDNDVAKQYGIRAIPQNILVDPQGKIIAKNLSGEELDQKLSEVLH